MAREQYGATLLAVASDDASSVSDNFPANCEGVTSVGALDSTYHIAPYSALGAKLYLPGIGIPCAHPLGANFTSQVHIPGCVGTSVSSAVAVGLRACGFLDSPAGQQLLLATGDTTDTSSAANGTADVFAREFGYNAGAQICVPGMYVCNSNVCCDCQPNNFCYLSSSVAAPFQAPCPGKAKSIVGAAWTAEKPDWISGLTYAAALDSAMGRTTRVKSRYCVLCEAGSYFADSHSADVNVETCFQCPSNSYCPGDNMMYACPTGFISPPGSTVTSQCVQCATGTFWNGYSCASCLPGYYWNTAPRMCTQCPVGTYGSGKSTSCLACEAGKIASATGQANCTACGAGYFAISTSSCLPCDPGKYWPGGSNGTFACLQCSLGYISAAGASSCTSCGPGTYSDAGQSSCAGCGAGKYSAGTANSACTDCAAGSFSPITRATSVSACQACNGSGYSASNGATACSTCAPDFPIASTAHTGT